MRRTSGDDIVRGLTTMKEGRAMGPARGPVIVKERGTVRNPAMEEGPIYRSPHLDYIEVGDRELPLVLSSGLEVNGFF